MAQDTESRSLDKVIVRLPDGMRDRIKESAERNGRSMNAEIVQALEMYFPPAPSLEEVLDKVHNAIETAQRAGGLPYRQVLIEALDELSERLTSGIEFDQFQSRLPPSGYGKFDWNNRYVRWKRAQKYGVEQEDLEREIAKGLLRKAGHGGDTVRLAIKAIEDGHPERALRMYRLDDIKFADPKAAIDAIESDLRSFYEENWGDISEAPPWEDEREQ